MINTEKAVLNEENEMDTKMQREKKIQKEIEAVCVHCGSCTHTSNKERGTGKKKSVATIANEVKHTQNARTSIQFHARQEPSVA